ncbi:STAS domain-containing protein [Streptomyces racemochromogenes]|uniref:Anti-sigma factor antagonist n=1 Tax=Streptomyces racemochromogenes TaxID=67353 RepID=A0ABW7PLR0_9ACTN
MLVPASTPVTLDHPARPGGVVVCRLAGEIDIDDRSEVIEAFARATARATTAVVVDCRRLAFCDSTLLNALLRLRRQATAAGLGMALADPGPQLLRLLEMTGAGGLLPVHPTLGSALDALGAGRTA